MNNFLALSAVLLSSYAAPWCDEAEFDMMTPYNDCLSIQNKQERQKCVAQVAFSMVAFPNSYHIINLPKNVKVPWFTEKIVGRITPTGIFPDYQQNVDYLYGIASASSLYLGCETPGVVPFKSFPHFLTSERDVVSVRYDYTMGNYPDNTCTMNFTLSGFMRFNDEGTQIKSYDFTLQRWGLAVKEINRCRGGSNRELGINFICMVEATKCTTPESQQYDHDVSILQLTLTDLIQKRRFDMVSFVKNLFGKGDIDTTNHKEGLPKCREFLRTLDKGTWDHVITNTVTCRVLHSFLAIAHPELHCKHIGESGGMACKDYDYDFYYNGDIANAIK